MQGDDLRLFRFLSRRPQKFLARILGVNQSTISRIESGSIRISRDREKKILRALVEKNEGGFHG